MISGVSDLNTSHVLITTLFLKVTTGSCIRVPTICSGATELGQAVERQQVQSVVHVSDQQPRNTLMHVTFT